MENKKNIDYIHLTTDSSSKKKKIKIKNKKK